MSILEYAFSYVVITSSENYPWSRFIISHLYKHSEMTRFDAGRLPVDVFGAARCENEHETLNFLRIRRLDCVAA